MSWRDDPLIQDRMVKVVESRLRGKHVNEVAAEFGISRDTVYDDINHYYEWIGERGEKARDEIRARLEHLIRDMFERVDETSVASQNKSQYYGHLLRAVEMLGKLDGLFGQKVEHSGPDGAPIQVSSAKPEELTADYVAQVLAELDRRHALAPREAKE